MANITLYKILIFDLLIVTPFFIGCDRVIIDQRDLNDKGSSFIDSRDLRSYKTVKIDSQIWMAENLAYIPFIGYSKQEGIWVYDYQDTSVTGSKASRNYVTYGCLYNWEAAKNICPSGWHLPSDNEWKKLTDYIRKDDHPNDVNAALKSTTGWMGGTWGVIGNGTDNYGFDALPAGARDPYGDFYYIFGRTGFWTSTKKDSTHSWVYDLIHTASDVRHYGQDDAYGFSIRCIKDDPVR